MSEDALEEEDDEVQGETLPETQAEEHPRPDSAQPPENACIISLAAESGRGGKAELIIDDSTLCLVDPQQQQAQPHSHLHPSSHHQQQQQLQQLPSSHPNAPAQQRKMKYNNSGPSLDSAGEDELVIFGQSIASQLRTITDSYSRSVAKLRIQQVLFEAETGQFQSGDVTSPHIQQHTF